MSYDGVPRLEKRFRRPLTESEIARGYVYITRVRCLRKLFNPASFGIDFMGERFPDKRLDVSGRVHLPRALLRSVGTDSILSFHVTKEGWV